MALIVGICGGTGSGKTTVAEQMLAAISPEHGMILHQDHYYHDLSHLLKSERDKFNFDHPDSLDWNLFFDHLTRLNRRQAIEKPIYSFQTHCRLPETKHVEPRDLIIVEGILVFENERLRQMMDIKIFVDTDADVRFIRRLQRDVKERNRTIESVVDQYLSTVRPMHLQFVEPSKRFADLIIPEGGQNRIAIDTVISKLQSWLQQQASAVPA